MKNKILIVLFMLISLYSSAQEMWLGEEINPQKWIEENDIESIEKYCRQRLFTTYGGYADGDLYIRPINNEIADKVLSLLQHGADLEDANCQFMLACVLSGNKTIRGYDEDYNEVELPTPKDYKYLDDKKAKHYFKLHLLNPKMDKKNGAFGYSLNQIMKLIGNAYSDIIEWYKSKETISEPIKEGISVKFGLG